MDEKGDEVGVVMTLRINVRVIVKYRRALFRYVKT